MVVSQSVEVIVKVMYCIISQRRGSDSRPMAKRRGLLATARKPHTAKSMGVAEKSKKGGAQKSSLKKRKLKIKKLGLAATAKSRPAAADASAAAEDDMFASAISTETDGRGGDVDMVPDTDDAPRRPEAFEDVDKNEIFRRVCSFNAKPSGMIPIDAHRARQTELKNAKMLKKERKQKMYERLLG